MLFRSLGKPTTVANYIDELSRHLLLKTTGDLNNEGSTTTFLGRRMTRKGGTIVCSIEAKYFETMFDLFDMSQAKPVVTPGVKTKDVLDGDDALGTDEHGYYRQLVGKLQWIVPLRPDIAFATKELARSLTNPTVHDKNRAKHLIRYLRGTSHYSFVIRPQMQLNDTNCTLDINVYVDSD